MEKRNIIFFILSAVFVLGLFSVSFADDEDMLITYPDGSYGVDLGGGMRFFQAMKDLLGADSFFCPRETARTTKIRNTGL